MTAKTADATEASAKKGQFFLLGALLLISAYFVGSATVKEVLLIVPDRDLGFLSGNAMDEYPVALNLGLNSSIGAVPALANFSRFLNGTLAERYVELQALWVVCQNTSTDANITVGNWLHTMETVTLTIGGDTQQLTVPANSTNYTTFTSPGANFTLNVSFSQSADSLAWWRDKVSLYVYLNMSRGDNAVIKEDDY